MKFIKITKKGTNQDSVELLQVDRIVNVWSCVGGGTGIATVDEKQIYITEPFEIICGKLEVV